MFNTFMPAILDSRGAVVGMVGGTQADHDAAEREARAAREAEGPPTALEPEIRALLGLGPYNETDPSNPWVYVLALGFPRPYRYRMVTDARTRETRYADDGGAWDRRAVRAWLAHFDAVTATTQPPAKRHRHLR